MEDMIVECNVPEGYYCTVAVLTEAHELVFFVGGILLVMFLFFLGLIALFKFMDR